MKSLPQAIAEGAAFVASLPGVEKFSLIGSAMYLPADQVADVDYAVLLAPSMDKGLVEQFCQVELNEKHGFEHCSDYDIDGSWRAMRRGDLNLMVTSDAAWFERYLTAMEVCKALRLTKKDDRILVCMIVRDGRTADQVAPTEDLFQ